MSWMWIGFFVITISSLAYHRASLSVWTLALVLLTIFMTFLSHFSWPVLVIAWLVLILIFLPLQATKWRRKFITAPILRIYKRMMPTMSHTEREALAAGTVAWEGDLFKGNPDWNTLLAFQKPELSSEERAFLEGPVETLCAMVDDWHITHQRADMPPDMWTYIKEQGFFALIIPKEYGGKAFSAYAHSQILTKVYGRSATVASTIAVPNSLGPAELLLHYGTEEQKTHYLPRLASGEEIPCFALTGPDAGSDAGAMTDTGIVSWGMFEGKKILGIRLNFNKRYITLAPVATVIGLAFKLYDPDQLLGEETDYGITCALIPRQTPGITIGRRHFPANIVFQNGPIQGENVFIPVEWIIGGPAMAGHGWRMLMECLAAGRAISLPASGIGGAKVMSYVSGAYARIRHQFNVPIGYFEGIEEVLARIGGYTYLMDATRTFTVGFIDAGEKPAVASGITKYHVTELSRKVATDAMDLHGGKAICLGPSNYVARGYEALPIAITVEGANILTRNMIIFGQGAMRCHPYIFAELEAAKQENDKQGLMDFDKALFSHMGFTLSNFFRSFLLAVSGGWITRVPEGDTAYYFRKTSRFSAAFALLADVSLLSLGGSLKRKENISARLGDILSYLYMMSAVLKHYDDQGRQKEDLPLLEWANQTCLYATQQAFLDVLQNLPNRWLARCLHIFIFPLGAWIKKPKDALGKRVAQLLLSPTASRSRLAEGAFITPVEGNILAVIEDALHKSIAAEPIEAVLKSAAKEGLLQGETLLEQAESAVKQQLISPEQQNLLREAQKARQTVIAVDDFASDDLAHLNFKNNKPYSHAVAADQKSF